MSWKDMLRPRQINFSAFVTFFSGIGSDVRLNRHKKRAARSGEIMRNRGRLSLYGCGSAALALWLAAAPVAAAQSVRRFDIPAGDLGRALNSFARQPDRTRVGYGKSGSVRVNLGGRRNIKKKKKR